MGRCLARILYAMLVDDRPRHKTRAGRGRGSHKRGLLWDSEHRRRTPRPHRGPRRAQRGGHSPAPARTRTGPGRDAVLHLVRRARARAHTDFIDRGGHLHRRHTRPISRPLAQAASGGHPPAVRLTGDRAGGARQPGHLGPWTDPRRQDGQDAGAAARRSAAAAGHHRHVDRPRPARSRATGRDGLQLCPRLGRRRQARRGLLPVGQALVAAAPGKRPQAPRRPDAGRRGLLPDGDLEHLARVDDAR